MSEDRNKWIDAVAKMIELTQEGKLRWSIVRPGSTSEKPFDDIVDAMFHAKYKSNGIRLYRRRYTAYRLKDGVSPLLRMITPKASDLEGYSETEVILQFESEDGQPIWTYPKVPPLSDLLTAVQFQVAGVKDFLNDILSEDN